MTPTLSLSSESDRGAAPRAFVLPASPAEFTQIGGTGADAGVREVGEDTIDPETEELQVFQARIAVIVGSQIFLLVSEREDVHEQAELVRVGDDAGCFLRRRLRRRSLGRLAVGVDEARRFLEKCRIFALAESLGGVESLIEHPAIMTHASVPPEQRDKLPAGWLYGSDLYVLVAGKVYPDPAPAGRRPLL